MLFNLQTKRTVKILNRLEFCVAVVETEKLNYPAVIYIKFRISSSITSSVEFDGLNSFLGTQKPPSLKFDLRKWVL